jgi:hypothetical protein
VTVTVVSNNRAFFQLLSIHPGHYEEPIRAERAYARTSPPASAAGITAVFASARNWGKHNSTMSPTAAESDGSRVPYLRIAAVQRPYARGDCPRPISPLSRSLESATLYASCVALVLWISERSEKSNRQGNLCMGTTEPPSIDTEMTVFFAMNVSGGRCR